MDQCGKRYPIVLALALLFAACEYDNPVVVDGAPSTDPEPVEQLPPVESASDGGANKAISDPFRPRLSVSLDAEGLTPGELLTVSIEGVANEKITRGKVEIVLPTLAAMEHAGPDKRPRYLMGEKTRVAASWNLPVMEAGATWKQRMEVGRVEKGYYHVAAHIETEGPGESEYVMDSAFREAWLFVSDDGGSVTRFFDEKAFAEHIIPKPGPFEIRRRLRVAQAPTGGAGATSAAADDPVYVKVLYYNKDGHVAAEGIQVFAEYIAQGDEWGPSEEQIVPSSGVVAFSCPEDDYTYIDGRAYTATTNYVEGGHRFFPYWEAGRSDCGDTLSIVGHRHYYIPWNNLNTVIPTINSGFGGFSRAAVTFKIDLGEDRSSYDPDDDEITFGQSYAYRTVAGHEYTHALQNKALGGTWRDGFMGIRNCWGHETDKVSSYKCGLREGLADYGGRVGVNEAWYWENKHYDPPADRGAGEIEGNVAALFHDLIDSNNEGGDNTTYGAKFVLTVFKTCRVPNDQRDDTGDFVWCMENRVDEGVHDDHFPGLSAPSGVRHSAAALEPNDYDADDVRNTWIGNVG